VLAGAGCRDWICGSAVEMAEMARALAADVTALAQRRIHQRQRIAASALLNHADLARTTERSFRQWWRLWLKRQGWSQGGSQPWPGLPSATLAQAVPLANSTNWRLPLWLGAMTEEEREHFHNNGHELIKVDQLCPWGLLPKLFQTADRRLRTVVHLEQGDMNGEQQRRWQRIYPQLSWDHLKP